MNQSMPMQEQYTPEYTKLHNGFARKNVALNKMVCTKGVAYLGYYVAIMDKMGDYSRTDFGLSREELVEELRNYFALFTTPDEELANIIDEFIEAGVLERRIFVNPYTDLEEVRYCIPQVQEDLLDSRGAWYGKCINPLKLPKPNKEKIKALVEEEKALRREISKNNAAKRTYRAQLALELTRTDGDRQTAQALNALIDGCEKANAALYRKVHRIAKEITTIQGGTLNDDSEF